MQASGQRFVTPSLPAKSRPANSRRFLIHWRGRRATSAARATGRGSATAVTAIGRDRSPSHRGTDGQPEVESAAAAELGIQFDPATEGDRELTRNRQAQSGAAAVARPERAED